MDGTVDLSVAFFLDVVWFVEVDGRYQLLEFVHWWFDIDSPGIT